MALSPTSRITFVVACKQAFSSESVHQILHLNPKEIYQIICERMETFPVPNVEAGRRFKEVMKDMQANPAECEEIIGKFLSTVKNKIALMPKIEDFWEAFKNDLEDDDEVSIAVLEGTYFAGAMAAMELIEKVSESDAPQGLKLASLAAMEGRVLVRLQELKKRLEKMRD